MTTYYPTIGLEIHAELDTNSKMWCGCKNSPDTGTPNEFTCPVCMAHPGTLPVPNIEAITLVAKVGLAVGGTISDFTEFDRKNYYYPDIPKAYQLSQYKYPIVTGGSINGIDLTRIHLEEDTAKSSHHEDGYTLVDFNRAGVPLMELVTEPVIHDARTAGDFARELQRILRTVGASQAHMDKGHMRVEANISISPDPKVFGTKVEVKNINSFASVESAIAYEIARHTDVLDAGGIITQETRGWDEVKQETFPQRKKENANDYRYFPDPDLPKLALHTLLDLDTLRASLPMLPEERRTHLASLGVKADMIEILVDMPQIARYFDDVTAGYQAEKAVLASNYLIGDMFGILKKENISASPEFLPRVDTFRELLNLIESGDISSRGAKDLLPLLMHMADVRVKDLATEKGLIQVQDKGALTAIVQAVLKRSPEQIAAYKSGKEQMFMYFVGQCMKDAKGAGNPQVFQEILREQLA